MIRKNEIIKAVMDEFNSMNIAEKHEYLDRFGFKYTVKEKGKIKETSKIKKINNGISQKGISSKKK